MKKLLGKKVSDLGFSDYLNIQRHCCEVKGSLFSQIDRFFASSKLCNVCGSKNKDLSLKDRTWSCPFCNSELARDKNAAIICVKEKIFS